MHALGEKVSIGCMHFVLEYFGHFLCFSLKKYKKFGVSVLGQKVENVDHYNILNCEHYINRPFSYCIDYQRSERVGPFTRICRPDGTKSKACPGQNCQQMQMCGDESLTEISEKSLSDKLTCE